MRNKFAVKTFLLTLAPRSRFSTPSRGLATLTCTTAVVVGKKDFLGGFVDFVEDSSQENGGEKGLQ